MKLLFPAVALVLALVGTGCNKGGKLDTASTFTPPAGPTELKLKWTPGERVVQEVNMTIAMDITVPGRAEPMHQNITVGQKFALTVLSADADGSHEVELEFLSIKLATAMGQSKIDYDSDKHSAADANNPIASMLNKIIGSRIQYFLDASNNVARITGVDAMVDKLSGANSPVAMMVKGIFNEDYFNELMSANRFMPTTAVAPGDTWPVQVDVPTSGFGTMSMNYTITFKDWEKHGKRNCARLEFEGSFRSQPGTKPGPMGVTLYIQNGDTTGAIWFDPELGIAIDGTDNRDMTMVIGFPGSPRANANNPMQSMTNQLSQTVEIKLDSVK